MKIINIIMDNISKICLVIFISTTHVQSSKDFCDIRTWYLKLISDGVFNVDLTPEMFKLKQNIETLVLNSADGLIDCQSLVIYNIMLKDKFNYKGDSIGVDDLKEITTHDKNDKIFGLDDGQTGQLLDPTKETVKEDKIAILQESVVTESKEKDHDAYETNGVVNVFKDKIDQVNIEKDHSENVTQYKEETKDLVETGGTEQSSDVNNHDDSHKDLTDIDETDLLDDESELTDSEEQIDESELIGDTNANEDSENEEGFVTRTIPFGVCKSFGCLQSDVFDVFGLDEMTNKVENGEYENTKDILYHDSSDLNGHQNIDYITYEKQESHTIIGNEDRNTSDDDKEPNSNVWESEQGVIVKSGSHFVDLCLAREHTCSNICLYVTLHTFCLRDYDLHSMVPESENTKIAQKSKDGNVNLKELDSSSERENNKFFTKSDQIETRENSEQIEQLDEPLTLDHVTPEANSELRHTESIQNGLVSGRKDNNNGFHSDTGQNPKDASENSKVENKFMFSDFNEVNKKLEEIENENNNAQDIKASKISVDEFEKIIHQTTNQYAQKIQTLELMIMKLENQLLVEKLNKQNHSSTITRLENLILKLENDFLKLNTQYDEIKTDNENISKRQNHYLEIAYKNQKQTCKQLQLPDKSAKTSELLSQHQSKIMELTDILRNQSSVIKAVKDRYNSLEEQNRMLHQMIMNQTIFMTSIIHTLQDLSKQNSKNKEEIQELRGKLASEASINSKQKSIQKDNILDAIDKYAYDEKINIAGNGYSEDEDDDNAEENESDRNLKLYLHRKSSEESIKDWCPLDNDTCPSCYYRNILHVNCIPFKPLFWGYCGATCKHYHNSNTKQTYTEHSSRANSNNGEQNNDKTKYAKEEATSEERVLNSQSETHREKDQAMNTNNEPIQATKKPNVENDNNNKKIQESKTKNDLELNSDNAKEIGHEDKHRNEVEGKEIDKEFKKYNGEKQINIDTTRDKKEDAVIAKNNDKHAKNSAIEKEHTNTNGNKTDEISKNEQEKSKNSDTTNVVETSKDKTLKDDENKSTNKQASNKEKIQTQSSKKDSKETKKAEQTEDKTTKTAGKNKKAPVNINKERPDTPKDCYDYYKRGNKNDGIYKINPIGLGRMIEVFCDMRKGGWTVIQRRQDGTMKFFREWNEYKKGFGGLYGEHWLGNENIHFLTNQDYYKLRVDLMDWDKNKKYAEYDYFLVENEDNGYRINIDGYTGDAGDGLSKHHGHKFSTKDMDNDKVVKEFGGSCAVRFHGAGWYYKCYASNLNGKYYKGGKIPEKKYDGVTWKPWTGPNYSLKKVEIKIKPANNK